MNAFQLFRLFRTIYRGAPPDTQYIQSLGLLAVKIGQAYAPRADFLPESSCRELAKLYRQTDPVGREDLVGLMGRHANSHWWAQFQSISELPLACASVGQVHSGILRSGKSVAVKVIRRDFRSTFQRDVQRVGTLLKAVIKVVPKLARVADPIGTLHHIESTTIGELNLLNEVKGQEELSQIYEQHKDAARLAALRFPMIYRDLTSEQVMVSELIEAPTFDELLEAGSLSFQSLLDLFEIHGFFLFCVGTFHGDLHPGNVMLKNGEIWFLDTGAISRVSASMRQGLFWFFDALVVGDFNRCARSLERMSRSSISSSQFLSFSAKFADLYRGFLGRPVGEMSLTRQMMMTIRLAVESGMNFETGMYPIVKSLMYLDGMVLRCAPQIDLMAALKPYMERFRPWVKGERDPEHREGRT